MDSPSRRRAAQSGSGVSSETDIDRNDGYNNIEARPNHNQAPEVGPRSVWSILGQWWPEFFAFVAACGLLAAIFGVLEKNADKRSNYWTISGLSLNSFVALLSAILRALVLLVVEEVISQHKWLWQLRRRPVGQMNSIDEASKSLLGSFLLPFRLRTWFSNMYIGCLIMILSLAIGPFSQQAVGTKTCSIWQNGVKASVPYTTRGPEFFRFGAGLYDIEPGYAGRMASACMDPSTQNSTFLVEGCSTGNCTFVPDQEEDYSLSTLGVCSRCMDTTKYLQKKKDNSSGYDIVSIPDLINMTGNYQITGLESLISSLSYAQADFDNMQRAIFPASILNYTVVGTTSVGCSYANESSIITGCTPPSALDFTWKAGNREPPMNVFSAGCTFYLCNRHHNISVDRGVFKEELISSSPGFHLDPEGSLDHVYLWKNKCKVDDETIDMTRARTVGFKDGIIDVRLNDEDTVGRTFPNTTDCLESVSWPSYRALQKSMQLLNGTCRYPSQATLGAVKGRREQIQCDDYYLSGLLSDGLGSASAVSSTFEAVANAVTNRMREMAVKSNFSGDAGSPTYEKSQEAQSQGGFVQGGYVYGNVQEYGVCTEFHGEWLIFPLLLLVATALFLLHTVIRSVLRRHTEPLWKSSLLPALYASPESQLQAGYHSLQQLEEKADQDSVQLVKTGDYKWELVKDSEHSEQELAPMSAPVHMEQEYSYKR
ncbi:unnamed protein product [Clonostachys rosea]|uniref:Uncharacterized protein n=1 Tax=Bionectria ochroleuca TaxID=29856 RepID=A0ABY6U1P7_BIOOC|nr:unnamed protein product [Clonostachys rosea]